MLPLINVSCQAIQPNTHCIFHNLEPRKMQFLPHSLDTLYIYPRSKVQCFQILTSKAVYCYTDSAIALKLMEVPRNIHFLPKGTHSVSNLVEKNLKKKKQLFLLSFPVLCSFIYIYIQSNFTNYIKVQPPVLMSMRLTYKIRENCCYLKVCCSILHSEMSKAH